MISHWCGSRTRTCESLASGIEIRHLSTGGPGCGIPHARLLGSTNVSQAKAWPGRTATLALHLCRSRGETWRRQDRCGQPEAKGFQGFALLTESNTLRHMSAHQRIHLSVLIDAEIDSRLTAAARCRITGFRSRARPRYVAGNYRFSASNRKVKAVVPSTASRRTPYPLDSRAYKRRNLIERMFCKLKNWRRIATRYDRYAQNYLSGLALAAIMIAWI